MGHQKKRMMATAYNYNPVPMRTHKVRFETQTHPSDQSHVRAYSDIQYQSRFSDKLSLLLRSFLVELQLRRTHRSSTGLLLVLVYFSVFYFVLFGMASAMLYLYVFHILSTDYPPLTGQKSLLRLAPKLSFVPVVDFRQTLIHFTTGVEQTYKPYMDHLLAFVQYYEVYHPREHQLVPCSASNHSFGVTGELDDRRSCHFDIEWAQRCNIERQFGYDDACPCIILKLNPVYGWIPDVANGTLGPLVTCRGSTKYDDELIENICYYDALHDQNECAKDHGVFPHYFYPYLGQENYQPPLVFVEFQSPTRYVVIRITCEVIAPGLHDAVHFQLLMD